MGTIKQLESGELVCRLPLRLPLKCACLAARSLVLQPSACPRSTAK